jgi:hypothetical protein
MVNQYAARSGCSGCGEQVRSWHWMGLKCLWRASGQRPRQKGKFYPNQGVSRFGDRNSGIEDELLTNCGQKDDFSSVLVTTSDIYVFVFYPGFLPQISVLQQVC